MNTSPMTLVLSRVEGLKKVGGRVARCPAHDDHDPSLGIDEGDDGRVLLCCRAGCQTRDVLAGLKLEAADLFATATNGNGNGSIITATYEYRDEIGELLFQVVRMSTPNKAKDFRQRGPDGRGGWEWTTKGTRKVIYNLADVLYAVRQGVPVWIVEGEKDAEALGRAGEVATTNPRGAGKWRTEYSEYLRNATVVVVADQDDPGRAHAAELGASLVGVARSVRVVAAAVGKDAADHLAAGKTVEEFVPVDAADPGSGPDLQGGPGGDLRGGHDGLGGERDLLRIALHGAGARARIDGASFILDTPSQVVPVWGRDEEVLWAQGEPLLINVPTGVGKTTIAQQLVLARLGMRDEELLHGPAFVVWNATGLWPSR